VAEAEEDKPPTGSDLSSASERIRETAKWLVVTFGGVAGVLVAGLQLTSLKDTVGDDRTAALLGYGLAVAGALLTILAAAVTLTAGRRTLHDLGGDGGGFSLRNHLNAIEDLRGGFDSIAQLVTQTNEAIRNRTQAWLAWREDPNNAEKRTDYDDALAQASVLVPIANRLLEVASFEHLRRTWAVCRLFVAAGAVIAAVGVAIFAANAEEAEEEEPAIAATPVVGVATLTEGGLAAHRAELGTECSGDGVGVVVTAAEADAYSLVVVPTAENRCGPAEISLKRSEGSVTAAESVQLQP
jgi:hypothetical protein